MKRDNEETKTQLEPIHISTTLTTGINRQIIATTRNQKTLIDFRKEWGGDETGPTPPEYMAIALGGCLMNIARIIASERQIELKDISLSIQGEIDPSRAFGIMSAKRAGFSHLSAQLNFVSELSSEEKEEFYQQLMSRCPLCDTISNKTPLEIEILNSFHPKTRDFVRD